MRVTKNKKRSALGAEDKVIKDPEAKSQEEMGYGQSSLGNWGSGEKQEYGTLCGEIKD